MEKVSGIDDGDGDARLMRAYARGSAAAFDQLYAKYKGALYRYFLRQCHSREQAEELYQDAWMRVIRARRRYRPKAGFSTWLFRIAHNLLIDHYRKASRQAPEVALEEVTDGGGQNPEARAAGQERLLRLQQALRSLPREQRDVFLLKEEGGLGLDEIASLSGISFEAAKSRLRYAVRQLKQALREADGSSGKPSEKVRDHG